MKKQTVCATCLHDTPAQRKVLKHMASKLRRRMSKNLDEDLPRRVTKGYWS